ncbi:hypothetical protein UCMB321_4212 [Pseudomonas batumici]|uniref:Uncharacterized protein n=1 Tax=Pseudomonas batumici TaxID=226910 RepID=A0A0C2I9X0_9PSED|nr:hypothetical protein UCMB321_4212 [Pseudomonas batumici]
MPELAPKQVEIQVNIGETSSIRQLFVYYDLIPATGTPAALT